ncbi:hypothetical protein CEXT_59861 [Caerostris extrusa]|uniref:Uncharacterized protein n=1 Tax=Caerostris extrusa TaxID=172846 RepID=A0AAV4XTK7_CAEEX|nr:hypothetical protein CEXT_59861 [Caerostris extrusa]
MSTIGMDLISTKSFSLITEGMGIRTFLFKRFKDGLPCNFRFAKQSLWPIRKVLAFRRTFQEEWIEKINDVLSHNSESGWLQQRMIDELSGYTECLSDGSVEVQSLQLDHTVGTFLMWMMGLTAAFVVLLVENSWQCKGKKLRSIIINRNEWMDTTIHKVSGPPKIASFKENISLREYYHYK